MCEQCTRTGAKYVHGQFYFKILFVEDWQKLFDFVLGLGSTRNFPKAFLYRTDLRVIANR
jgi:hypothetical protein